MKHNSKEHYKSSEGKLRPSEEKFKAIFENVNDGILAADVKTKRVVLGNAKICKITGYSLKELLNMDISNFCLKKDLPDAMRQFNRLVNKEISVAKEMPILRKDKDIVYCNIGASFVEIGGRKLLLGFFRDVTSEKKAKESLEESEEKFKAIFESSSDALMTLFPPSWKFTSGNPATVKLFNTKDEKEYVSCGPWQLSPKFQPDGQLSGPKAKKMIMKAMKDGSNFFEWTHCTKQGKPFPATVLLTRITWNGKAGLQATVRDITYERRTKDKLIESEQKFRNFFENSNDSIFIADTKTKKLVDCNKKAELLMEYPKTKILSMNADELHPKDKIKETIEGFKKQLERKIDIFETEVLTKSGKRIPVSINASVIRINGRDYMQGLFRNITERKKAEEYLKKEKNFVESVLDNIPNMVFVKDAMQFKFEEMNKAGEVLLGLKKQDILGKNLLEKFSKKQSEFFLAKDREVIKTGKLQDIPEESINTPHGTRILHTKKIPIFDEKGKPLYLLGISEDITEKKKDEQEVVAKTSLLQAQYDTSIDGILVVDSNGKTLTCNKSFVKILGIPDKILQTKDDKTMISHVLNKLKSPDAFVQKVMYLYEHKTETSLDEIEMTDGRILERYSSPLYNNNNNNNYYGRIWYFRDITTRKKSEKEIKEFNNFAVGRELKMIELKEKINSLLKELGRSPEYNIKK